MGRSIISTPQNNKENRWGWWREASHQASHRLGKIGHSTGLGSFLPSGERKAVVFFGMGWQSTLVPGKWRESMWTRIKCQRGRNGGLGGAVNNVLTLAMVALAGLGRSRLFCPRRREGARA